MLRVGAERDAADRIAPDFVLACIVALEHERALAQDDDAMQIPGTARCDEIVEPGLEIGSEAGVGRRYPAPVR